MCDTTATNAYRVCLHGNIGVGKTTMAESKFKDFIIRCENLTAWDPFFESYYWIIQNYKPGTVPTFQQVKLVEFQLVTSVTRAQDHASISQFSREKYVFERSIQESYYVFIPCLKKYITNDLLYNTLRDITYQIMTYFEPSFDEDIYLHEEVDVLMERIMKRNRPNEHIPREYLQELQNGYKNFKQHKLHQKQYVNQTYVIGSIGVGKTSFINNIGFGNDVVEEPIDYWGQDVLTQHINNVNTTFPSDWFWKQQYVKDSETGEIGFLSLAESQANLDQDVQNQLDNISMSFIFQLRVISSRFIYQKDNRVYERNVIEEWRCLIPGYEHVFTENQMQLLKWIYELIIPHFVRNSGIYIVRAKNLQQQMFQIMERNRRGEQQYGMEYIDELNQRYEKLENLLESKIDDWKIKFVYQITTVRQLM